MDEKVVVYKLKNSQKGVPFSRKKFYDTQIKAYKQKGQSTKAVEIVNIFIFNQRGELLVQKRSSSKRHNPNLQDKSIGGHIKYGDTSDFTVMVETIQELKVPSIVLRTNEDFKKTYKLLLDYVDTVAIAKHIDSRTLKLKKVFDNEEIVIANKVNVYLAVYEGRVKAEDREAKGILYYSIPDLKKEIKRFPDTFTYDLKTILKMYSSQIDSFIKEIRI
jgi:isopentenyldiphosphate isomerase